MRLVIQSDHGGGDDPQGGGGGSLIPPSPHRPQFYARQANKAEAIPFVGYGFAYSCVEAAEDVGGGAEAGEFP